MTTKLDLPGLEASRPAPQTIHVGDTVRTDASQLTRFSVVALYDRLAWVRDADTGACGLASLDQCRKVLN